MILIATPTEITVRSSQVAFHPPAWATVHTTVSCERVGGRFAAGRQPVEVLPVSGEPGVPDVAAVNIGEENRETCGGVRRETSSAAARRRIRFGSTASLVAREAEEEGTHREDTPDVDQDSDEPTA